MLAAASTDVRDNRRALGYLAWVRYQPLGAATMRTLVDRAARRRGAEFAALAARYGVVN